jgi:hydrogenase expression/formation protein HypD
VFKTCDRAWRGIGVIPRSGLELQDEFMAFDAARRFESGHIRTEEPKDCIAGEILLGHKRPSQCSAFGAGARPSIRSEPPWCRPRARAPRTTRIGERHDRP